MAGSDELTPFKAAARILDWLEAIGELTLPINLDLVRQIQPMDSASISASSRQKSASMCEFIVFG